MLGNFGEAVLRAVVLLGLWAFPSTTVSGDQADQPVILGTAWGYTLAGDGSGFYNDIAQDFLAPVIEIGVAAGYQPMPYRRARARFLDSAAACLYPTAIRVLRAGGHIASADSFIESDPLFTAREYLFAQGGVAPPASLSEIDGKTVAVPSGSVMFALLKDTGAQLIPVHDETDKAQMLLTGRVDLMTGMLPNETMVFSNLKARAPSFDRQLPLIEAPVSVVCHNTVEGRAVIKAVNEQVTRLSADNRFQRQLARAGVFDGAAERGAPPTAEMLNALVPAAGGAKPVAPHPGRRMRHAPIP